MKNISRLIAAASLALSCAACGTQWSGNYTGTWQGTASTVAFTNTTFQMTLYQSGSNINGYWLATGAPAGGQLPVSGQVTGTISGSTLTAVMNVPINSTQTYPGAGSYTGSLQLNASALTGSLTGTQTSPIAGSVTATLNLTQQR